MSLVYYSLIIIFYFLGIFEILIKKHQKKYLYIIATILLIIFVGFKKEGGTDFINYKEIYESIDIKHALNTGSFEPIFTLLMFIVRVFGGGFALFYLLIAFINFPIKVNIFKKLTPYLFPALLIYFVGLFFERDNDGIRQGLAIGFSYLSIPFLLVNDKRKFILINIIASLIHYSSIIFFISYFLNKIHIKNKTVFVIIICSLFIPLLNLSLFDFVIKLIPIPVVTTKLNYYANDAVYSSSLGINIGMIFRIVILFLFIYYYRYIKIDNKLFIFLRNGFAFGIFLALLFSNFEILAHRGAYVFRELQIFIIPYFLTIYKKKSNKIILLTIVFLYSIFLLKRFLSGENSASYLMYDNYLFFI